ncbi:hypothetical protein DRQ26_06465, partial [bacterium]
MDWILVTKKNYPIFARFWIVESFRDEMKRSIGMGFKNYKSLESGIYAEKNEFIKLEKSISNLLYTDIQKIKEIELGWETACKRLINQTNELGSSFENYSNEDIITTMNDTIKLFKQTSSYIFLHHAASDYIEQWLGNIFEERKVRKEDIPVYFSTLTTSPKTTLIQRAHL